MLSRKEYEEYFGKISDAEWTNIQKQISEAQERIWEEEHPLDD